MKKKLLAVILTATLVASSSVIAYAEVVQGDVESLSVGADEEVTVEGNVTKDGIQAGTDSTVEVTGNVEGTGTEYGMGVFAASGASVTVGGDVTSNSNAIEIGGNNVEVTVSGNVTSNNGEAVAGGGGSSVVIKGNATAGDDSVVLQVYTGDSSDETTQVTVGGDTSGKTGAFLSSYGNGNAVVVVEGTLKGTEDAVIFTGDENKETVLAFKVEGNVSKGVLNETTWEYDKTDAPNLINYILVKDSDKVSGFESGTTEYTVNGKTYDTAKEGASVVIKMVEGYAATCSVATITKNADGTFTLIVPKGGGVTISAEALQDAIDEAEEKGQAEVPADNTSSSVTDSEPAAPAAPAASVIPGTPGSSTGLSPVALGDGAYVTMFTTLVNNTPYGGTVEITVSDEAYLNDVIVASLATRSDVSVKINVMVGGELYLINIPAGYDLRYLIGTDGKISIAALIQLFGKKTNI
ncbi:MAG: hypothetical protein IJ821_01345 [Lachnospiraceae bacterium]|nr:hypothetical protein [Lachnospiraceae bacterium]